MNNNSRIRKQRITALTLVMTLLMGGCNVKDNSKFEIMENENNEIVASDDSYVSDNYITNYYVIEVYNKLTKKNEILIGRSNHGVSNKKCCFEIFTNLYIQFGEDSIYDYVKHTRLGEYIFAFGLGQAMYSYDDMKNIYEVIKENYVFDEDDSLRKIRTFDNKI